MIHVLRASGFHEAVNPLSVVHEHTRADGSLVQVSAWGEQYRITVRRPSSLEPSGWDRFPEVRTVETAELAYWLGTDGHREASIVLPGVPA